MAADTAVVAQRTQTATRLLSSSSTIRSSINQQQDGTILCFKRHNAEQAKLRLSLQNISDSTLHFQFKKSVDTTMAIDPRSTGVLEPHSSNDLTISWDHSKQKPSRHNKEDPFVKMILHLAIDGKFDEPQNSSSTRLVGRLTPAKFDANAPADVLVVDSPNMVKTARHNVLSTARSSNSLRTCLSRHASSQSSMEDFDEQERRRFNWLYLCFIIFTLSFFFVYTYWNWKQSRNQINNAK